MAYFSNSTEQEVCESMYCNKCGHGQDEENNCPIMFLHWLHNYEECNVKDSFLNKLIPREDGHNGKCVTFRPLDKVPPGEGHIVDSIDLTKWKAWATQ